MAKTKQSIKWTKHIDNIENVRCRKTYFTHYNGGRPFKVCLQKHKTVLIYDNCNHTLLHTIPYTRLFVGKCPLNTMTKFSGAHGKMFNGNSILLHTKNNEYTVISHEIFSFKTNNDKIVKYFSPIDNLDISRPFAIGKKYIYTLDITTNKGYIDKLYFPSMNVNDIFYTIWEYEPFMYDLETHEPLHDITLHEYHKIKTTPINLIPFQTLKILAKIHNIKIKNNKDTLLQTFKDRHIEFIN